MKAQSLGTFSISSLVIGFGFLYIPMLILVIYSFNASRLVTVWAGFSTKWYVELFQDQQLLDAAWMSLKIAFLTACMSLVMGMLASLALVPFGAIPGYNVLCRYDHRSIGDAGSHHWAFAASAFCRDGKIFWLAWRLSLIHI